jgi:NAD(P)-dependent dehydrogenase (short-subunit alcohol dehydrogenase family)
LSFSQTMDPTKPLSPTTLFSAHGLTIVITGGATGIGQAFLSASVQTGATKVFILGRRADALERAAQQVDPSGKTVVSVQCDVSSAEDVERAVQKIKAESAGRVDVLVNNAGVGGPDHKAIYKAETIEDVSKTLLDDEATWTASYAINTIAPVRVAAAFLPLLQAGNVARGWQAGKVQDAEVRKRTTVEGVEEGDLRTSQIITIASIAGYNRIMTIGMPYAGSKAAVLAEMKVMAHFLGPWGIRCNVICPGSKFRTCIVGNQNLIASSLPF